MRKNLFSITLPESSNLIKQLKKKIRRHKNGFRFLDKVTKCHNEMLYKSGFVVRRCEILTGDWSSEMGSQELRDDQSCEVIGDICIDVSSGGEIQQKPGDM